MLVPAKPAEGAFERSDAEHRFDTVLRSWIGDEHLRGLAMLNVSVPSRHGSRRVGGVVVTPAGLVVVDVHGFTEQQRGTLSTSSHGPWTVESVPAKLDSGENANPWSRLETDVFAVQNALHSGGLDSGFVSGLVVVMPYMDGDLALREQGKLRNGLAVVLGEQKPLRRYFHRMARGRGHWSADDVLAACVALDVVGLAPQRAELVYENFTEFARRVTPGQLQPAAPRQPIRPPRTAERSVDSGADSATGSGVDPVSGAETNVDGQGESAPVRAARTRPAQRPVGIAADEDDEEGRGGGEGDQPARSVGRPPVHRTTVVAVIAGIVVLVIAVLLAVSVHSLFHG
jgi:hypothetical protein